MTFLSWNIRGLRGLNKKTLVRTIVGLHNPEILCLQETKLENHSTRLTRAMGGANIDQWESFPAIGASGGILLGWNSRKLTLSLRVPGTNAVHVLLRNTHDNQELLFSGIYSPRDYSDKKILWEDLKWICNTDPATPWLLGGDFNVTTDNGRNSKFWQALSMTRIKILG